MAVRKHTQSVAGRLTMAMIDDSIMNQMSSRTRSEDVRQNNKATVIDPLTISKPLDFLQNILN